MEHTVSTPERPDLPLAERRPAKTGPEDILFAALAVIVALLAVVPRAAAVIFDHVWSWEGVLLCWGFLSPKRRLLFCAVVLAAAAVPVVVLLLFSRTEKWRRYRWTCLFAVTVIALLVFPRNVPLTARWFEKYDLIAHAGGRSPNGNAYNNSLEAFEHSYQLGHRVFEGDLCTTADGILVLEHDWEHWRYKTGETLADEEITYAVFMATRFHGTETPMDLAALIDLMIRHEDMYFMTDVKDCYQEDLVRSGFQQVIRAAEEAGRMDVLDRFIIQNYHDEFKDWVDDVYHFENWLYTLYAIPVEERVPEKLVPYCEERGIPVITMWEYMADDPWIWATRPQNIRVFVHTLNDAKAAQGKVDIYVSGVYTDDIQPGEITVPWR